MRRLITTLMGLVGLAVAAEPIKSIVGMDGIERSGAKPYKHRVEYLESTGTQYIDTGICPSADLTTYITFCFTAIWSNCSVFGSKGNREDRYWVNYDQRYEIGYGSWSPTSVTTKTYQLNSIIFNDISDGTHKFIYNGSTYTKSGSPNTNVNIIVYGRRQVTQNSLSKMRCYSMKMVRANVNVLSFIPVIDNTDEPCMYDEVSGGFFYNKGTGHFIAGPIVE